MTFACARNAGARPSQNSHEEQVAAEAVPAPYDNSLSYLRAVVVNGMKPDGPSSLEINLTVTEILDAARRSATSGKTIRLPASRWNRERVSAAPAHQLLPRRLSRAPESLRQSLQKIGRNQRVLTHLLAHHVAGKPVQMHRRKHRRKARLSNAVPSIPQPFP